MGEDGAAAVGRRAAAGGQDACQGAGGQGARGCDRAGCGAGGPGGAGDAGPGEAVSCRPTS
ncbi:hypothetical protein CXZ10_20045 [Pleomorphomonas diazotrophica]|uniref:Uncharacterized protein n=1 Tax=Pleomorphomonas diazotrophica TaxID=1166257 RepID=A0A2N3LS38_9HYPH|nr:hypothetical protein CXZ10_20045 [Pleomorphomonas diazotrophica]